MARFASLLSGARRRERGKPKLPVCLNGPFEPIALQSAYAEQPSVRGWWPAGNAPRISSGPYSLWDSADFGLAIDAWLAFLKSGAPSLLLRLFPREGADHIISVPRCTAPAPQVRELLKTDGATPRPQWMKKAPGAQAGPELRGVA